MAGPAVVPGPVFRAEWRSLPPIQRVVAAHPLVNPVGEFSGRLTAWQNPSYLAPLGHAVGPSEPSGSADIAVPVRESVAYEELPVRVPVAHEEPPVRERGGEGLTGAGGGGMVSRFLQRFAGASGAEREAGGGAEPVAGSSVAGVPVVAERPVVQRVADSDGQSPQETVQRDAAPQLGEADGSHSTALEPAGEAGLLGSELPSLTPDPAGEAPEPPAFSPQTMNVPAPLTVSRTSPLPEPPLRKEPGLPGGQPSSPTPSVQRDVAGQPGDALPAETAARPGPEDTAGAGLPEMVTVSRLAEVSGSWPQPSPEQEAEAEAEPAEPEPAPGTRPTIGADVAAADPSGSGDAEAVSTDASSGSAAPPGTGSGAGPGPVVVSRSVSEGAGAQPASGPGAVRETLGSAEVPLSPMATEPIPSAGGTPGLSDEQPGSATEPLTLAAGPGGQEGFPGEPLHSGGDAEAAGAGDLAVQRETEPDAETAQHATSSRTDRETLGMGTGGGIGLQAGAGSAAAGAGGGTVQRSGLELGSGPGSGAGPVVSAAGAGGWPGAGGGPGPAEPAGPLVQRTEAGSAGGLAAQRPSGGEAVDGGAARRLGLGAPFRPGETPSATAGIVQRQPVVHSAPAVQPFLTTQPVQRFTTGDSQPGLQRGTIGEPFSGPQPVNLQPGTDTRPTLQRLTPTTTTPGPNPPPADDGPQWSYAVIDEPAPSAPPTPLPLPTRTLVGGLPAVAQPVQRAVDSEAGQPDEGPPPPLPALFHAEPLAPLRAEPPPLVPPQPQVQRELSRGPGEPAVAGTEKIFVQAETAAASQAPASAGGGPGGGAGGDPDELLKKLFDPLLRRLRAELRLDRDRRGTVTDLRF
ncbi:hypothetical protein [Longispora albida]|uniref:hypothetical protein n=1 Tax=Longispora albida TaxID=203523 RepID=UPI00039BE234|nr:hypothetical protein [Longispora albida]